MTIHYSFTVIPTTAKKFHHNFPDPAKVTGTRNSIAIQKSQGNDKSILQLIEGNLPYSQALIPVHFRYPQGKIAKTNECADWNILNAPQLKKLWSIRF